MHRRGRVDQHLVDPANAGLTARRLAPGPTRQHSGDPRATAPAARSGERPPRHFLPQRMWVTVPVHDPPTADFLFSDSKKANPQWRTPNE
jgi:hypothetical protein